MTRDFREDLTEFKFWMYLASLVGYLIWVGVYSFDVAEDPVLRWYWVVCFCIALLSHIYLKYDTGLNWGRKLVKMPLWKGVVWPLLVAILWAILLYLIAIYFYGFYSFDPVLYGFYVGISLLSLRVAEKFGEYFGSRGGYVT